MVHCSLGHDTTKIINKPEWWPQDVKFSSPLTRPKKLNDVSNYYSDSVPVPVKYYVTANRILPFENPADSRIYHFRTGWQT